MRIYDILFFLLSPSSEIQTNCLASMNAHGQIPVGNSLAESSWRKNRNSALWEIPRPLFSLKINQKSQKSNFSAKCRFQVFFLNIWKKK